MMSGNWLSDGAFLVTFWTTASRQDFEPRRSAVPVYFAAMVEPLQSYPCGSYCVAGRAD
jgi:hypothetical protein